MIIPCLFPSPNQFSMSVLNLNNDALIIFSISPILILISCPKLYYLFISLTLFNHSLIGTTVQQVVMIIMMMMLVVCGLFLSVSV